MRHPRLSIVMTTSLIATGIAINDASHAIAADNDNMAKGSNAPVATHSQNPLFEYSARKILGFISEARVAASNEQKEVAIAYIDESLRELNSIRNARNYLEMMGVRFGRVLYGQESSYYIPIADDTYAVRTYARGPFWASHKGIAVRDVEMVNVNISINPEKATAHLQAAKEKINGGDYKAADTELKDLLDESLTETTATDQPLAKLQDNIYLARILIRQENYDGARYALKHAKNALNDYEKSLATPESRANADNLRNDIDTLDETIQKRDPTLLKKAADKVDGWWKKLKSWTRDKTS